MRHYLLRVAFLVCCGTSGGAWGTGVSTCTQGCHEDLQAVSDGKHAGLSCEACHPNVKDGKADHGDALTDLPAEKSCAIAGCHPRTGEKHALGPHKDSPCDSCHGAMHDSFTPQGYGQCKKCHKEEAAAHAAGVHGHTEPPTDCGDCHGDLHEAKSHKDPMAPTSKVMQVTTCGECHDSEKVRAYRNSVHGQGVLRSGLSVAPACTSCHGTHDIVKVSDPASRVSPLRITDTCGGCHEFIEARWKKSTHGQLWMEQVKLGPDGGIPDGPRKHHRQGPVCSNCHSGHQTFDPTVYGNHLKMADKCGECHPEQAASYRDSFHGKATKLGFAVAATCADCHTPHEMLPSNDPHSSVNSKNLGKTCARCHPGASAAFVGFSPHLDPKDPEKSPVVHYVWLFMTVLLIGVLSFFGLHTLLWLQRSVVALVRGEHQHQPFDQSQWVRRFRPLHIGVHITVVVTFLTLAATGLPLKLSSMEGLAGPISHLFGGLGLARWVHRIAGVATFSYGVVFAMSLYRQVVVHKRREILWGWKSMTPALRDLKDLIANLKYFLYLGKAPRLDRWAYWEKFDFFAVFWGVPVIGFSGLMLWFPKLVTDLFPGWVLNIAYLIHSDEALLATGFIFFFHFFHTHLRPEAFPLDPVIFLGRMPLDRFKLERPDEYARVAASGELKSMMVDPPTELQVRRAYRWGFVALTVGVLLGAGLLVAGLGAVFK